MGGDAVAGVITVDGELVVDVRAELGESVENGKDELGHRGDVLFFVD